MGHSEIASLQDAAQSSEMVSLNRSLRTLTCHRIDGRDICVLLHNWGLKELK